MGPILGGMKVDSNMYGDFEGFRLRFRVLFGLVIL